MIKEYIENILYDYVYKVQKLRYEAIVGSLDSIQKKLDSMHTCSYDKLCLFENHFWISNNLKPIKKSQKCLCGKKRKP